MTASITPDKWLQFTEQEYLVSFVRDGGSAMKFAVPLDDTLRPALVSGLAGISNQAGYLVVTINAAETRIHMIDEIFFRTAEQVPWQILTEKVIAKLAADCGYSWVQNDEGPLYLRLAEKNEVDPQMLLLDLKKAIGSNVFKQSRLSRDFRVAMTHLCIAVLAGGSDGATTTKALTDWLMGHNRAISAVKPYQIFRKINRATARYFFESLIHWLRLAEYPGMVMLLDAQRVMLTRNPNDPGFFYSKATRLDSYEVLRQFIDGSDKLEGCFIAVIPHIDFLHDHKRGLGAYEALKFRVFDEIRDKGLVNPMASLVRISATF